jgi:hypothetical protein
MAIIASVFALVGRFHRFGVLTDVARLGSVDPAVRSRSPGSAVWLAPSPSLAAWVAHGGRRPLSPSVGNGSLPAGRPLPGIWVPDALIRRRLECLIAALVLPAVSAAVHPCCCRNPEHGRPPGSWSSRWYRGYLLVPALAVSIVVWPFARYVDELAQRSLLPSPAGYALRRHGRSGPAGTTRWSTRLETHAAQRRVDPRTRAAAQRP